MHTTLDLNVTYYDSPRHEGMTESQLQRRDLHWQLPINQIALILVDVWSEHYLATHLERAIHMVDERIVPITEAFRKLGVLVVHAPSPDCARKYPQWLEEEIPEPTHPHSDWPPENFRRKTDVFAPYARPKREHSAEFDRILHERQIAPQVHPKGNDRVVTNGESLHHLLQRRGALFLFYMGFAANICVPFRDYGMRAMKDRDYEIILVEDCTTACEVAETVPNLLLSRAATIDTALTIGYTLNSSTLLRACHKE